MIFWEGLGYQNLRTSKCKVMKLHKENPVISNNILILKNNASGYKLRRISNKKFCMFWLAQCYTWRATVIGCQQNNILSVKYTKILRRGMPVSSWIRYGISKIKFIYLGLHLYGRLQRTIDRKSQCEYKKVSLCCIFYAT